MRRADFLVAKDPATQRTGDMAMLTLVLSLARESLSVRTIALGEHPSRRDGRIVLTKPDVNLASVALRTLRSRRSLVHERFDVPALRAAIDDSDADLFVADHAYMAESFLHSDTTAPLYVNTVVSEALVWQASYGLPGRMQQPRIRQDELRVARAATSLGAYDEEEASDYRAAGIARAAWLDLTLPAMESLPPRELNRPRIAFVGDRRWPPNDEGARLLLSWWPAIARGIPGAELLLIGRPAKALPILDGVRDLGFVDDLDGLLATCRGILAPIRTGGGVRVKILEAASRGIPVVGTHAAIGSLGALLGLEVHDSEAEFVAAARRLLMDDEHSRRAGAALDERNRAHWAAHAPQRTVAEWLR